MATETCSHERCGQPPTQHREVTLQNPDGQTSIDRIPFCDKHAAAWDRGEQPADIQYRAEPQQ
jgi:hypothetical protein